MLPAAEVEHDQNASQAPAFYTSLQAELKSCKRSEKRR